MSNINDTVAKLEFIQIGWVVPDIYAAVAFLENALRVAFPKAERYSAGDLKIKYYGKVVPHEGLVAQTYNGGAYIELIQPLSGESLFQDYLTKYPAGVEDITKQGYQIISGVDHRSRV
jgi:hypothetical protein